MCNQVLILQFALPLLVRVLWRVSPNRRKRLSSIRNESENLLEAIEGGIFRRAVLVYDNSISPPSYGDFINVLMLARFLSAQKIKTKLLLTNNKFLPFFADRFTAGELNEFVQEQKGIASNLVEGIEIEICSLQDLGGLIDQNVADGSYIVFHELVKNHKPIYFFAFNLTKSLLAKSTTEIQSLTYLSRNVSFVPNRKFPDTKYIAFPCRWNNSWGQYRNMSTELFLNLVKLLSNEFPTYELVAISDQIGCDHFRTIAKQNNLDCRFSKDYSDSFLGDVTLLLNCEAWVQIHGGGIGNIALWSDLPFLWFGRISSEQALLSKRTSHFISSDQRFFIDYGLPSEHRMRKWLLKMASDLKL